MVKRGDGWKYPEGQAWHSTAPGMALNPPARHSAQVSSSPVPSTVDAVPKGHGLRMPPMH